MMRASYDMEADSAFFWFAPEGRRAASTYEIMAGVMMDFDESGDAISLEVLNLRARLADRQQPA